MIDGELNDSRAASSSQSGIDSRSSRFDNRDGRIPGRFDTIATAQILEEEEEEAGNAEDGSCRE